MEIHLITIFILYLALPLTNAKLEGRIINGYIAAPGQFPWFVSMIIDKRFSCGATLLSSRWIITAEHCFPKPDSKATCYLGTLKKIGGGVKVESEAVIKLDDKKKDICLVKLSRDVQFTDKIKPALLPKDWMKYPKILSKITAFAGTGHYAKGRRSDVLRYTHMKILERKKCKKHIFNKVSEDKICAETVYVNQTMNPCFGDSGGGLIYNFEGENYILGVLAEMVGKEEKCYEKKSRNVFESVLYNFKWIKEKTGV